ncbi:unnamed protein product [Rotaria sp. Silwood2]|nr:unnamed protein product [Rotaria sp. Silwood2]CAF3167451.1 unnamed protein product [Rotaria sp. Silwood2]CAF3467331.1 unnamed protein product [Rotaria sp. Silwood2]CAF4514914.1 unnamed protein product [Rotaria sp. Silwood2]CAF4545393.1 unnamed protein product [Rotaria sp. Silwood2]
MYFEIPYIGSATEKLKSRLKRITHDVRPDIDARFFTKPLRSVQTYFPNNEALPKEIQSDIVYAIQCKDCKQIYVGKTEQQAIRRMRQHGAPKTTYSATTGNDQSTKNTHNTHNSDKDSTTTTAVTLRRSSRIREKEAAALSQTINNPVKKTTDINSALADHQRETRHSIDWENYKILWRDNLPHRLLLKESLVIKAHQPALNRTTHSVPLLIFPEGVPPDIVPYPHP